MRHSEVTFYGNSIERAIKTFFYWFFSSSNFSVSSSFPSTSLSLHFRSFVCVAFHCSLVGLSLSFARPAGLTHSRKSRSANVFSPINKLRNSLWIRNFRELTIKQQKNKTGEERNRSQTEWREMRKSFLWILLFFNPVVGWKAELDRAREKTSKKEKRDQKKLIHCSRWLQHSNSAKKIKRWV